VNSSDRSGDEAKSSTIKSQLASLRNIGVLRLTPFAVTKRQLVELFNSPSLVRQQIKDGQFLVVRPGGPGREALYDFESAQAAYERIRSAAKIAKTP